MKVELSMPESASQYSFAVRNVLCKDNLDKLFLTSLLIARNKPCCRMLLA